MGPSFHQILIILLIVALLFGAAKLPQIGKGLGEAIKNFKKSVNDINEATDIDITPIAKKTAPAAEEKQDSSDEPQQGKNA